jgi:ankyrin repeat protein
MVKSKLTKLFLTQLNNDHKTLEKLIKSGNDINEKDQLGRSVLMYASQGGQ